MTVQSRKRFALNVVVRPARFLFEAGQLDVVQEVLAEQAPTWTSEARMWRSRADQKAVDLLPKGAIETLIREEVARLRPAAAVNEIDAAAVPVRFPRFHGSVELRGRDDSLTVLIRADEYLLMPSAGRWLFANEIALQVRRTRVENVDAASWAAGVFEALCSGLAPLHGDSRTLDEFEAKNISNEGGAIRAIGVDASRYLPGIYWLNYFGETYCELIGVERLLSAPAHQVREVAGGVLLQLAENPRDWSQPAYRETEDAVLSHIGSEFFFSRQDLHRRTLAPEFLLPVGGAG